LRQKGASLEITFEHYVLPPGVKSDLNFCLYKHPTKQPSFCPPPFLGGRFIFKKTTHTKTEKMRVLFEGSQEQIENLIELVTYEATKRTDLPTLKIGDQINHLWSVRDVQTKFDIEYREAMDLIEEVMESDRIHNEIWEAIVQTGENKGLVTKDEIKEERKKKEEIVAQFIGMQDTDQGWYDSEEILINHFGRDNCFDELLFSKSWDWLKPTIRKVCSVEVIREEFHLIDKISDGDSSGDILDTFEQVVNAIVFYNKSK
jgi:hypothetical protein